MVDIHRFVEISESTHRIMNPISEEKLRLVIEICPPAAGERHLDLACGKGELVCQLASRHGTSGVGIDIQEPLVRLAEQRARELGVDGVCRFVVGDAGAAEFDESAYDVVSCIGATWIGGGLSGTLALMSRWAKPGAWLLVGEAFWNEEPPPHVRAELEEGQVFADLGGTLDRFDEAGADLVEMVLADHDDWDRYQASQWLNVARWLDANSAHPDAAEVRAIRDHWRREYLAHQRRCLGWGIFVLRAT